jgi:hypothetical protein
MSHQKKKSHHKSKGVNRAQSSPPAPSSSKSPIKNKFDNKKLSQKFPGTHKKQFNENNSHESNEVSKFNVVQKDEVEEERNNIIEAGEGLCWLLEKCLSPDPRQRPQLPLLLSSIGEPLSSATKSVNNVKSHKWLKAFQNIPLRFGHAFGKPKTCEKTLNNFENVKSDSILQ